MKPSRKKLPQKKPRVTIAQVMERLDSIETLINRVWSSIPDRFSPSYGGASQLPAPCLNGSCGLCGKCLPVVGCGYGITCPQNIRIG